LKTHPNGINGTNGSEETLVVEDKRDERLERNASALTQTTPAAGDNTVASTVDGAVAERRANLSAAKRVLLEKWLRGEAKPVARNAGIPRRPDRSRAPLSFAQQRLWFFSQLDPASPLYNIPFTVRLKGPLNVPALQSALDAIVVRHEVLRTHFISEDGSPVQVIAEPSPVQLTQTDLSRESGDAREAKLKELVAAESRRPFDLARDLMVRAWVAHLGAEEHLLLLTMHHIASDQWSWGIFLQELSALYEGFVAGRPASLPLLPIQYADFAVWQRNWLSGPVVEKQLAYWKDKLAGAPAFLELPTDRPRPPVVTFRGEWQMLALPGAVADAMKELARREGATLFMTMLAAFGVLLNRYTQQRDLLIGTPIAGRTQVQTEGLIGFFVNTLPMRVDLKQAPSFRELLRQVKETTLEAFSYQDLPFEKLVEELRPERSAGYSPLLQVMFVMRNASTGSGAQLPGLVVSQIESSTGTAKFDLTLLIEEGEHGIEVGFEYNCDLFERSTILRMLSHYRTLLESIAAEPTTEVSKLSLLTPAERHQLLAEWSGPRTDYPRDETVPTLFERQVALTPEADAVLFRNERLSYAALNRRANRLAHALRRRGVARDVPVALCLERSADLIVALLAVLKAGGAYASLDPSYPKNRLSFMLNDLKPAVLITQQKLRAVLPDGSEPLLGSRPPMAEPLHRPEVLCIDADWDGGAEGNEGNLPSISTAEDLAYICYTSGSTGRPKGVCVPHRGVVRLVKNTNFAHFGADEVFLQLAPVGFDASTLEIWGPLLNGGRLVVFPPGMPSLSELGEAIHRYRITTLWLTAGLFHQMVEEQLPRLQHLRQLLAGGDTLSPSHVRKAVQALKHGRVINGYGPTENTTFSCCHALTELPPDGRPIPIGRAIANSEVYILDENREPVPIGVPGELYVGGDGLARGYLNQAALSAEKFVPHPFKRGASDRLYRTGDRARYLPSGEIEFLGRIDLQVKVRGFRIELEEIEAVLGRLPGVRECAVAAIPDTAGDKRLVAYVVLAESSALTPADLRNVLQAKLPDFMMPSAFVFLDKFPLTPNGKVDRRALPAPGGDASASGSSFVAPRDEFEARLARTWESVLGVQPIGIKQGFFELGGHSLLAVRLIAHIEKEFGRRLPVSSVFQAPSVEQLAAVLRDGSKGRGSTLVAIQPHGTRPPLFLVHGVGGGMFWGYANLARHLGSDQPVYAFKPREVESDDKVISIEEMAANYVRELRQFQPCGPYRLGGYCFGGNVAYEMACQLRQQGERVDVLALMNCSPPNSSYDRFPWTPIGLWRFTSNLYYWVVYFFQWPAGLRRQFVLWKLQTWRRALTHLFRSDSRQSLEINPADFVDLTAIPEEQRRLWSNHVLALSRYRASPYRGRVLLFRTHGHRLFCSFDPQYGWGELALGGLLTRMTPGAHESLLEEPHVQALARYLSQELEASSRNGDIIS
jgi:amino acid adenylation domain-containing protein